MLKIYDIFRAWFRLTEGNAYSMLLLPDKEALEHDRG